jgi:hypothetical protein
LLKGHSEAIPVGPANVWRAESVFKVMSWPAFTW